MVVKEALQVIRESWIHSIYLTELDSNPATERDKIVSESSLSNVVDMVISLVREGTKVL